MSSVLLATLYLCRGANVSTGVELMSALQTEPDGDHVLMGDIDLTGLGYAGIPDFSGTLIGGGHVIRGLGSSSLMTSLSGEIDGVVLDGSVEGENTKVTFGSYLEFGLFAVTNCGGVIRNCEVRGYSLGNGGNRDQKVGFFAGITCEGARFENCLTQEGCSIYLGVNSYSGGIVGFVSASGEYVGNVTILSDCVNHAVTTKANSYNSGSGVGGILGGVMYGNDSCPTTRLERCTNFGSISFPSGNYLTGGGLVGKASNGTSHKTKGLTLEFVDCANYGDLSTEADSGTVNVGGMVGYLETSSASAYFTRCINRGNVSSASTSENSCAGGFVGQYKTPGINRNMEAINSANYGNVSGTIAGGFLGKFDANVGWACGKVLLYNCANYGEVSGETRGQFFATGVSHATSANVRLLFTNGWVPDSELYTSSMKEPEIEGVWTPDMEGYSAEAAVRALNAQVTEENGYERWRVAESGYPELRIFAPPTKHTVIRLL